MHHSPANYMPFTFTRAPPTPHPTPTPAWQVTLLHRKGTATGAAADTPAAPDVWSSGRHDVNHLRHPRSDLVDVVLRFLDAAEIDAAAQGLERLGAAR